MARGKLYWRGLHNHYLDGEPVPCDDAALRRKLDPEAFRPHPDHGNSLSLCEAGVISMETFLKRLQDEQDKKPENKHIFCAVAVLSESELEGKGFEIERDDKPYEGHANAVLPDYGTKPRGDRREIKRALKDAAIGRGVKFFEHVDREFRRTR